MSRHVLVAGATGLVGSRLLEQLAARADYKVTTVGRRPPALEHERVTHLVTDFSATVELPAVDTFFCCLGTTIRKAGSQDAFRAIDFDLVLTLADSARTAGCSTAIVVSSVGADAGSSNFYLRTKGEMEDAVAGLGFARCGVVRPSLLLGERKEIRPAEQLGKMAVHLVNPLLRGGLARYRGVDATTVAAAMIGLDYTDFVGSRAVEGMEIVRLAQSVSS